MAKTSNSKIEVECPVLWVPMAGPIGTAYEIGKARMEVVKNIPNAHSRIRTEKMELAEKRTLAKLCATADLIKIGDMVAYVHKTNRGTKKYPWIVKEVHYSRVKSIGQSCLVMENGEKPNHSGPHNPFIAIIKKP